MAEAGKPVIKLLTAIVDRADTRRVTDIFREEGVSFHFIELSRGTAGTTLMARLGLESTDKSFICCLQTAPKMPLLLAKISGRLELRKPGRGIAFTMPLSSINGAVYRMLTKNEEAVGMESKNDAANARKFGLILAVIDEGHVEELMEAARAAGARGGTVMHARRMDIEGSKFLGIAAQSEKDIVAILTTYDQKNDIMRAISAKCGMNTEARGVIMSLPVDDIEGLGSMTAAPAAN